jgi:hypothetical protein
MVVVARVTLVLGQIRAFCRIACLGPVRGADVIDGRDQRLLPEIVGPPPGHSSRRARLGAVVQGAGQDRELSRSRIEGLHDRGRTRF